MRIQAIYAAVAVAEMESAEEFYTALIGRGPDDRPMDGLLQWRHADLGGIQVFVDVNRAGRGSMTIVTPDIDRARSQIWSNGLELEPDIEGDFGVIAQISDPDGNRITLAEPQWAPG